MNSGDLTSEQAGKFTESVITAMRYLQQLELRMAAKAFPADGELYRSSLQHPQRCTSCGSYCTTVAAMPSRGSGMRTNNAGGSRLPQRSRTLRWL